MYIILKLTFTFIGDFLVKINGNEIQIVFFQKPWSINGKVFKTLLVFDKNKHASANALKLMLILAD